MQITLEMLEQALAPIEQIGKEEVSFEVNGTTVTMRRLSPEEDADVQKFATSALKNEETTANALDYIERFKLAVLSHAITSIGGMDLRDVSFIETAEKLDNGKNVKLPRVDAMRKLLLKWSAPIRVGMFRKYGDLLTRIEQNTESLFKFDLVDLDTEIERVEERLEQLKDAREKSKEGLADDVANIVRTVVKEDEKKADKKANLSVDDTSFESKDDEVERAAPLASVQVAGPRKSAIPTSVRPQPPTAPPPPAAAAKMVRSSNEADYAAGLDVQDSFVDMGDSSSMNDAIHAENARMMRQRQEAQRGIQPEESPSVLSQVHHSRRPPHVVARDMVEDSFTATGESMDGVGVYKVPEELVVKRLDKAPVSQKPTSSVNPRFIPPKRV